MVSALEALAPSDVEAREENDRATRDLRAQENMALYAYYLLGIALVQTLIGIFGIHYIRKTLAETRDGAAAARQSVDEGRIANGISRRAAAQAAVFSREAARHARQSLDDGREASKRQLRAYITVASGHYTGVSGGRKAVINVMLRNSGQTPAYNLRTLSSVTLHESNKVIKFDEPSFDGVGVGVLGAGGEYELNNVSVILSPEHAIGIHNGTHSLYVFGRVQYEDVFGTTQTLSIAMESIRPVNEGRLKPCKQGNEST